MAEDRAPLGTLRRLVESVPDSPEWDEAAEAWLKEIAELFKNYRSETGGETL